MFAMFLRALALTTAAAGLAACSVVGGSESPQAATDVVLVR